MPDALICLVLVTVMCSNPLCGVICVNGMLGITGNHGADLILIFPVLVTVVIPGCVLILYVV